MATISDYMKTRRYNEKLYERLLKKLNAIESQNKNSENQLELTISMSAKHQTPYVKIESVNDKVHNVEQDIIEALDEVGFTYTETEEKFGAWFINFAD